MSKSETKRPTIKDIPVGLSDIEALIGMNKVLILSREYGGQEVIFPKIPGGSQLWNELEILIGYEETKRLGHHCGANPVYIPMLSRFEKMERNRKVIQRFDELLPVLGSGRKAMNAVAKEFGMSDRWVRTLINR